MHVATEASPSSSRSSFEHARLLAVLNAVFGRTRDHWRAIGAVRRRRCQFVALGAPGRDFYVVVDADGARAVAGSCPRPHATWSSDAPSIDGAFAGAPRAKHVRVCGDVDALLALIADVAAARRGAAFRSGSV
jgi:hypothetical protein